MTERVWALDIENVSIDAVTLIDLRFSDKQYIERDDGPPVEDYLYDNRLKQPAYFRSAAFCGPYMPRMGGAGVGEAVIVHRDGSLNYLADAGIDGKICTLRLIEDGVPRNVLSCRTESLSIAQDVARLRLRDPRFIMERPIELHRYAGTNVLPDGVEGTSDIAGRWKPLVFGKVVNATPVCVNTSKLVYHVHDGSLWHYGADCTITAARDRGVPLTLGTTHPDLAALMAATVTAGTYDRWEGYLRVGTQPEELTVDAERDATLAGDVLEQVRLEGYSLPALDSGELAALNAIGEIGDYITSPVDLAGWVDAVISGLGAAWWHDPLGVFHAAPLPSGPAAEPDLVLEDWQIVKVTRSAIGLGPGGIPASGVTVEYGRRATVQTNLASTAPNPSQWGREYQAVTTGNWWGGGSFVTKYPYAQIVSVRSHLVGSGAASVASNVFGLLGTRRDQTEVVARISEIQTPALLQTVRLNTTQLGYPRDFLIMGIEHDAKRGRVTMQLVG